MQTKHLPTLELTLHPAARRMPVPNPQSAEFKALLGSITEIGIHRPLVVNAFRVVDNIDVWLAAKQLGITSVPVIEIGGGDVPLAIVAGLVARKQWTKSQVAYLAYPFIEGILAASRARRVANLKKGQFATQDDPSEKPDDSELMHLRGCKTAEQLAEHLGINRRFLFQAAQIHKAFDAPASAKFEAGELRKKFEPLILGQDENGHSTGLGAVVAGIAGYQSMKGETVVPAPQLTLWAEKVDKMLSPSRFTGWDRLEPELRHKIAARFRDEFLKVVPEEIQSAVLAVARTRRTA